MLELLLDLRDFSVFLDFNDNAETIVADSFLPKLVELADDEDEVVETEAPDDAETDVRMLFDFLSVTPEWAAEGHSGFSRHSSGLSDEKSARIPLSVTRDKWHSCQKSSMKHMSKINL